MENGRKDIELRSEEVQEILNRPPHALVRWGITVFFVVLALFFIGGCFFKYPDVILFLFTTPRPRNRPKIRFPFSAFKKKEMESIMLPH